MGTVSLPKLGSRGSTAMQSANLLAETVSNCYVCFEKCSVPEREQLARLYIHANTPPFVPTRQ